MRNKIVELALSQVGIKETPVNLCKYNDWYYNKKNASAAWCAVFVSWLANECGILGSLINKNSGCTNSMEFYKGKGQFYARGSYKPQKGDLIYINWDSKTATAQHIGIVIDCDNTHVYTVEGNRSDQVKKCSYKLNNTVIVGYAKIAYTEDIIEPEPAPEPKPETDILTLVKKTIRGDFGNGQARKDALGSNYAAVQKQVNLNVKYGTTRWDSIKLY